MDRSHRQKQQNIGQDLIIQQLSDISRKMYSIEKEFSPLLDQLHENFRLSGSNLLHYLSLRSTEIREIQEYLHHLGLSSLANSESHTISQLLKVLGWLKGSEEVPEIPAVDFETASGLRRLHAERLLGSFSMKDRPHIMVTFSREFIENPLLIEEMLNEGMTVARINCAHDTTTEWLQMILHLQRAVARTGRNCKIYMDLAGPKIRIAGIRAKKKKDNLRLLLEAGLKLILCSRDAEYLKGSGKKKYHALIVDPPDILGMIKAGEHVYFDDGKFEAVIQEVNEDWAQVEILRISSGKPFLKPGKGINLPDSDLRIAPLTAKDKVDLPFICEYADMVGYSFVSNPEDIDLLREEISKYARHQRPSIILKIERLSAVQNLPALLMKGMQDEMMGVMIARGDLAVQIGFERLSEIQEEILWICEAAHVPVIWATQVLESLNKTGFATRSEITDAAMGVRSECVMLNKGKYVVKTIRTLEDILTRQLGHVNKKRYLMRPLGIAKLFIDRAHVQEINS